MNDLSNGLYTTYAQFIILGVNVLAVLGNLALCTLCLKAKNVIRDKLRDVETTKIDIAELTDRFIGFQKREGMRVARSAKRNDADLLAELQNAATAIPAAPQDKKSALRAKLRAKTP